MKKNVKVNLFFICAYFSHLIVQFKHSIPFRKFKRADCGRCGEQEQLRKVTSHKDSRFIPSFGLSFYISEIIMVSPLFSTYRSPWLPSVKPKMSSLKCILRQQQFHQTRSSLPYDSQHTHAHSHLHTHGHRQRHNSVCTRSSVWGKCHRLRLFIKMPPSCFSERAGLTAFHCQVHL